MSDPRDQSLARAYELIEMDRLDEARLVLEPLLVEDPDNPDVWWLYAHAVDDPGQARDALARVRKLSPDYPGAAELQQQLAGDMDEVEPAPVTAATSEDDLDFDDDLEFDDEDVREPAAQRSRLRPLLLIALLIVLIVLLLFLLNPFGDDDDAEPTQIAQVEPTPTQEILAPADEVTPEVTAEVDESEEFVPGTEVEEQPEILDPNELDENDADEAVETDDTGTESAAPEPDETDMPDPDELDEAETESTASDVEDVDDVEIDADASSAQATDFSALVAALRDDVELFSDTSEIIQTAEFGPTLIVSVCSEVGDTLRDSINQVMLTAGSESERLPESVDGVGVRLINCDDGSSINTLAVSSAAAREYGAGDINEDNYRSQWRAIG